MNNDTAAKSAVVTKKVVRSHGGMPNYAVLGIGMDTERKLRLYWPYKSEIDGERFLTRLIVFRCPLFGMDITRIGCTDDQREWPHDHSRTFRSLKFGWYEEDQYSGDPRNPTKRHVRHGRFSLHTLRYTQAHSITKISPKLVTVLFTGRQRQSSNYWTPDGLQSIGMAVDQEAWA